MLDINTIISENSVCLYNWFQPHVSNLLNQPISQLFQELKEKHHLVIKKGTISIIGEKQGFNQKTMCVNANLSTEKHIQMTTKHTIWLR